jgi:hypothetical protein
MSQQVLKRDLPAYLEYASDLLANLNYRLMTLKERGLWDTMRKECWVNQCVPSDPAQLAKILNLTIHEVTENLSPALLAFFECRDGFYFSSELDNYKLLVLNRREQMSKGGSKGGQTTQTQNKEAKATLEGKVKGLKRHEEKRHEEKRGLSSSELSEDDKKWIEGYEGK